MCQPATLKSPLSCGRTRQGLSKRRAGFGLGARHRLGLRTAAGIVPRMSQAAQVFGRSNATLQGSNMADASTSRNKPAEDQKTPTAGSHAKPELINPELAPGARVLRPIGNDGDENCSQRAQKSTRVRLSQSKPFGNSNVPPATLPGVSARGDSFSRGRVPPASLRGRN
jgi:hypothetical protein